MVSGAVAFHRLAGAALAAVLATTMSAAAGGCRAGAAGPSPAPPAPTAPRSGVAAPPGPEADAVAEILARFEGFRRAEIDAYADPGATDRHRERLAGYLAGTMWHSVEFSLNQVHRLGVVREGTPGSRADVLDLRLDADPPVALVRECLDATGWRFVRADGGQPPPDAVAALQSSYPDRYLRVFSAVAQDDGWRFEDYALLRSSAC